MAALKAKCINNVEPYSNKPYSEIEVGKEYEVEDILMNSCHTTIILKAKPGGYNSVCFEFYKDGKPHDIYKDPKYNPYLK